MSAGAAGLRACLGTGTIFGATCSQFAHARGRDINLTYARNQNAPQVMHDCNKPDHRPRHVLVREATQRVLLFRDSIDPKSSFEDIMVAPQAGHMHESSYTWLPSLAL